VKKMFPVKVAKREDFKMLATPAEREKFDVGSLLFLSSMRAEMQIFFQVIVRTGPAVYVLTAQASESSVLTRLQER